MDNLFAQYRASLRKIELFPRPERACGCVGRAASQARLLNMFMVMPVWLPNIDGVAMGAINQAGGD
jgi:hypothetical protein